MIPTGSRFFCAVNHRKEYSWPGMRVKCIQYTVDFFLVGIRAFWRKTNFLYLFFLFLTLLVESYTHNGINIYYNQRTRGILLHKYYPEQRCCKGWYEGTVFPEYEVNNSFASTTSWTDIGVKGIGSLWCQLLLSAAQSVILIVHKTVEQCQPQKQKQSVETQHSWTVRLKKCENIQLKEMLLHSVPNFLNRYEASRE